MHSEGVGRHWIDFLNNGNNMEASHSVSYRVKGSLNVKTQAPFPPLSSCMPMTTSGASGFSCLAFAVLLLASLR